MLDRIDLVWFSSWLVFWNLRDILFLYFFQIFQLFLWSSWYFVVIEKLDQRVSSTESSPFKLLLCSGLCCPISVPDEFPPANTTVETDQSWFKTAYDIVIVNCVGLFLIMYCIIVRSFLQHKNKRRWNLEHEPVQFIVTLLRPHQRRERHKELKPYLGIDWTFHLWMFLFFHTMLLCGLWSLHYLHNLQAPVLLGNIAQDTGKTGAFSMDHCPIWSQNCSFPSWLLDGLGIAA